jgi:hypothetical protein
MWLKIAVCGNYFPPKTAKMAYFQRKIRSFGFSSYPDGSQSQLIRISGVLPYLFTDTLSDDCHSLLPLGSCDCAMSINAQVWSLNLAELQISL